MNALTLELRPVKFVKSIDEHVNTLVLPFIASAYSDEDSVFRHFLTAHSGSDINQLLSRRLSHEIVFLICSRSEARFKSIRGHYIYRSS